MIELAIILITIATIFVNIITIVAMAIGVTLAIGVWVALLYLISRWSYHRSYNETLARLRKQG